MRVVSNFPLLARDNNYSIKETEAIIPPLKSRNILPTDTGSLFNDFEAQPLMVKQHDATIGKYIKFPLFLSQCLTGNCPRSLLVESTASTIHSVFSPPFFTARFGLRDYGRRVRSDLQKNGGMEKQTVRVVISTWMLLSSRMAYWGARRVMQGRQLKRLG